MKKPFIVSLFALSQALYSQNPWLTVSGGGGGGQPLHTNISGAQTQVVLTGTRVRDGIIYAWRDNRTGSNSTDIYAQKLDPCGNLAPGWPAAGLLICNAANAQQNPQIIPDGYDGAIIVWEDNRNPTQDIYAARVLGNATTPWGSNGIPVCTAAGSQDNPVICTDGSGGAIIAWDDNRLGNRDIFVQKVSANGVTLFPPLTTLAICTLSNTQNFPAVAADSLGGAFIVWEDNRPSSNGTDIYGQRMRASGSLAWTANGIVICSLATAQSDPKVVNSMNYTATVAYRHAQPSPDQIWAKRIDTNGTATTGWTNDGNYVSDGIGTGSLTEVRLVARLDSGSIISFRKQYGGGDQDVNTQRMSYDGQRVGSEETTFFSVDNETNHEMCPDGLGSAYNTAQNNNNTPPSGPNYIVGRRFGYPQLIVCSAATGGGGNKNEPNVTSMCGVGYFSWEDARPVAIGTNDQYTAATDTLAPPATLLSSVTAGCPTCCGFNASATVCQGQSITFTCPLPAGLFNTYTFYDGVTQLQTGSSNTYTTSSLAPGVHTITVVSQTSSGCRTRSSNTITITVVAGPTVSLSGSNNPICSGNSSTLTAGGALTYTWSPATGLSATTGASVTANPTATTTYTVTGTNASGCTATAAITLTVNPLPSITSSSNSPLCSGNTLNLNASGGVSYSWTGPNAFSSSLQNPSIPNAQTTDAGTYTVVVTDANGCTASATVPVVIDQTPVASASSSAAVCEGGQVNLSASGGGAYSWTGPNSFSSTQQNPVINPAMSPDSGLYTVTVTIGTCTASATVNVVVNANPVAVSSSNSPVCSGNTLNLFSSGGGTYAWSGPNAFSSSQQNPSMPNAQPVNSGVYTVIVTAPNNCTASSTVNVSVQGTLTSTQNPQICQGQNFTLPGGGVVTASGTYIDTIPSVTGCDSVITTNLTVNPLPNVSVSSNSPVCENATLNLTSSGGTSYSWTGPNSFSSSSQNPSLTPVTAAAGGTYTVQVTDASNCSNTGTVTVVVNPLPAATASSNSPVCAGSPINLVSTGGTSWVWSGPNSFSSTQQNPVIPSAVTADGGTYTVTVTDANGCSNTATVTVVVNTCTVPVAGMSASQDTVCENACIVFTDMSTGSPTAWSWSFPGGNPSSSSSQNPGAVCYAAAGNYVVTLTVSNAFGTNTSTQSVTVITPPVASAGNNVTIPPGGSTSLNGSGGGTYSWYPAAGLSCTSCQNPDASPAATTTYCLIVTNAGGCSDTACVTVTVDNTCDEVFVPTAFSPNRDNLNDVFRVKGSCISEMSLQVFDRWGEKVFEATSTSDEWDGTYKGAELNTAVFAYRFTATLTNGETIEKKGNITLVR